MPSEDLPPLYLAVREATEALAEAERRHSLRLSLDQSLATEVRRLVELEALNQGKRIGILPLAKLDIRAELDRIEGPQDEVPNIDPDTGEIWNQIALCRQAIREVIADADTLTETKETVEFARRVLDDALQDWESSLRSANAEPARHLHRIDREHAALLASHREIREAIDAASKAVEALEMTEKSLQVAIAHSTRKPGQLLDGRSPNLVIEELTDNASPCLVIAQRWLLLLNAEIADLDETHRPTMDPPHPVHLALEQIYEVGFVNGATTDWENIRSLLQLGAQKLGTMLADLEQLRNELEEVRTAVACDADALDVERLQLLFDPPFSN